MALGSVHDACLYTGCLKGIGEKAISQCSMHSQCTLHSNWPPIFLSTHSLLSKIPRSVITYKHSPGRVNPFTYALLLPSTNLFRPSTSIHILLVGLLTICMCSNTGSLFQYFSPSHSLRLAIFCGVIFIPIPSVSDEGCDNNLWGGGGVGPPRTTVEMKPEF